MTAPVGNMPNPRNYNSFSGNNHSPQSPGNSGYEEFFGGAISCPTCHGSGRIPRDQENELVALIPVSDKRLKPRRTTLYVIMTIGLCLLLGGIMLFFFYPRAIQVRSGQQNLKPDSMYINQTRQYVFMTVTAPYNFTNNNFFPITVQRLDLTVFFDQKIVAQASNVTSISVPMRSTRPHYVSANLTFQGDEGYIAFYCSDTERWGHTLLMPFQVTATTSNMGRVEETNVQTYEHVRCSANDFDL